MQLSFYKLPILSYKHSFFPQNVCILPFLCHLWEFNINFKENFITNAYIIVLYGDNKCYTVITSYPFKWNI